ncbi:MAG: anti-sigma factor [Rhizobiaceae bacterium]|nr:anti-sigma factor [Rhizobiaceae bacterium]
MTRANDRDLEQNGGENMLAAEYVLGVLPDAERRQVAARIDSDPAFAREVDEWEVRLSGMADAYEPVDPPADLKQALDGRLFAADASQAQRVGFWSSLAFWRTATAAALVAMVVALAIPYLTVDQGSVTAERLVASLAHDDTDVHYFVVYDAAKSDVGLSHVTGARAEGRDFELWVIEGSNPPASLGVIPVGSNVHLAVTGDLKRRIEAGAAFAISMEPLGGSPTGEPTGPVVAVGDLTTI